jgi:hypothetical protein
MMESMMAWCATPGSLRGSVATETLGGIDAAIDAMPCQIVSAVRLEASGIGVFSERRFKLYSYTMAGSAVTGTVAHPADRPAGSGRPVMLFAKQQGVVKPLIGKGIIIGGIMAIGADAQILVLVRVVQWQLIAVRPARRHN